MESGPAWAARKRSGRPRLAPAPAPALGGERGLGLAWVLPQPALPAALATLPSAAFSFYRPIGPVTSESTSLWMPFLCVKMYFFMVGFHRRV